MFYIEKLNVADEVLNGEPKYKILDGNGNVIYNNCSIEQVTQVLQYGTSLNKALFDKIDYMGNCIQYLSNTGEDIKKFILTGEYNGIKTGISPYSLDGILNSILSSMNSIQSSISSLDTRVTALETP